MKVVAIIAARMASTRLPGKHLMDLGGMPMLAHVLMRAKAIQGVDEVVLATPLRNEDDVLSAYAESAGVPCFKYAPAWDVLGRYAACARHHQADVVVRLTADCPLLDPALASLALDIFHRARGVIGTAEYLQEPTAIHAVDWLDGLDAEVFAEWQLRIVAKNAVDANDREHVTPLLHRVYGQRFVSPLDGERALLHTLPEPWRKWSVDTPEDLARVRTIVAQIDKSPSLRDGYMGPAPMSWQQTVEAALRAAKETT